MSDKDLMIVDSGDAPVSKYDDSAFKSATKSGDYLPRIQLMTSNSEKCKGGDFPINHYALVRDQDYKDLGKEVDCIPLAWRPKALEMGEQVITVYDPKPDDDGNPTGEFARIQAKSSQKDSNCMYGTEYLLWIPQVREFATFFMGSASARRESPNLKARMRKGATLKSQHIKTSKYDWYAPAITACSAELDLPDQDTAIKQIQKFNNPPEQDIERVESDSDDRAR